MIAACGFGGCFIFRSFMGDADIGPGTLEAEEKAARAEGLPLEIGDVVPRPPANPSRNAGPAYQEICKALNPRNGDPGSSAAMSNLSKRTALPNEIAIVKKELAVNADLIAMAIEASKRPMCVFDRNWNLGATMLLPEYAQLKRVARLLSARAILAAREGRYAEAEEALRASFRIAGHVGGEPLLIALLVQVSIDRIAMAALQSILLDHASDRTALAMARRIFKDLPATPKLKPALYGEIVMGRIVIRTLKSLKEIQMLSEGGGDSTGAPNLAINDRMREAWNVRHLQYWRRAFKRINQHPDDLIAAGRILDEETLAEDRHKDISHMLNRILIPVFSHAGISIVGVNADVEVTWALLEVLALKKKRGVFPMDLAEVGEFTDPFDRRPLRYLKTAKGFKVWSIGRDMKDDGGVKPGARASSSQGSDMVVEFP